MKDDTGDNVLERNQPQLEKPNVSIFGMGYVGAVTAACLAAEGHRVIGVDPSAVKTDLIRQGMPPIVRRRPLCAQYRPPPSDRGTRPNPVRK